VLPLEKYVPVKVAEVGAIAEPLTYQA